MRPGLLHSRSAEKTARPGMFRHDLPSRWLHPLAPLKRLSPVGLPSANGFDKPFAASKFEKGQLFTGKHICNLKLTKCISRKIDNDTSLWKVLGMSICILAGIIALVVSMFISKDEYTILKKESLLFDYEFLKVLTDEYRSLKKKNMVVAIPCTVLFIIGLLTLAITVRGIIPWTHYHSLVFLGLSVGLFGFVYSAGTMEAYEVLVHNENYSNSFWFKVKRKAKLNSLFGIVYPLKTSL